MCGIVGFGAVGRANALGFSRKGANIIVFDPFKKQSEFPQAEDIAGLSGADFALLCLPTPTKKDGRQDLSAIESVFSSLPKAFPPTIVLRSTVLPGTSRGLSEKFRRRIVYFPEFLREKTALEDFLNPERHVIGTPSGNADTSFGRFLRKAFPTIQTFSMTFEEAETAKYVSNAFLAAKISFFNSIGRNLSGFTESARRAVSADKRIGSYGTFPGKPFSGPCLEKDARAFARKYPGLYFVRASLSENKLAGKNAQVRQKSRRKTRRRA